MSRINISLTLLCLCGALACSGDDESCSISVDSAAQTGNVFNVQGNFQGGQPVLTLMQNGQIINDIAATTYGSSSASFDLTGYPKGVYQVSWRMSCEGGNSATDDDTDVPVITFQ